ncbi:MAG: hypothetical protein NC200_06605 [Candidatus Gastranaerophilales bacterium]|nr:hypothetical protein [Candidatus Gastranaerophilales bacterium]
MLLSLQGQFLQKRLIKRMGFKPNSVVKGCTVDLRKEAQETSSENLDNEVKLILKRYKNNPQAVIEFIKEHNTNVYMVKNCNKVLKFIGEEEGLISERKGLKSLFLNLIIKNGFKFNTKPMIILNDGEVDIYNLMHYFHKWYALKDGLPGFDEKSQKLLKKFNSKNEDSLISKLSLTDIEGLKNAIARDVQSINFVVKYSKENAGAKKALEKLQTDEGASI